MTKTAMNGSLPHIEGRIVPAGPWTDRARAHFIGIVRRSRSTRTRSIVVDPRARYGRPERQQGFAALHLRFDIRTSSLPEAVKDRLLRCGDQRITNAGVVIIKA
jgi:hypothetical protein